MDRLSVHKSDYHIIEDVYQDDIDQTRREYCD